MKTKLQTFTGATAEADAQAHLDGLDENQIVVSVQTVWNVTDAEWNYTIVWQA